jgi:BASS family bile acid:Na+ symporter
MIGSISLTLTLKAFRSVATGSLVRIVFGHLAMPLLAYILARSLGLSSELTIGFVVLGAVTPELVTPVMTDLAEGKTALASSVLVISGLGSVLIVPGALSLLPGDVGVPVAPIVEQLAVAVVAPMLLAVGLRSRFPRRIGHYDDLYPAVSALMVILLIGGVTAANSTLLRSHPGLLASTALAALALNLAGYGVGALLGWGRPRGEWVAGVLSVGMRDFAIAAGLVVAAGLPAVASIPAILYGIIEMTTSAGLVRVFRRRSGGS